MANEAKTAQLFRKLLKKSNYYDDPEIVVEEQQSEDKRIQRLLQNASKVGTGKGYPDFIITSSKYADLVIVVECKADTGHQRSATLDSYRDYAVDGALLYASFLSREFDVIAIGFSGENERLMELDAYIRLQGERKSYCYFEHNRLLPFEHYHEGLMQSPYKFNQDFAKLIDYTKEINQELHDKKIKERLRSLLISGILIALKNERFKAEYKYYATTQALVENLYAAISAELAESDVPDESKASLIEGYRFVTTNNSINNPTPAGKKYLTDLITNCDERINGFNVTHRYIDTISQFYVEFLRYANNDKGLGIVLTPPHITDLFCALAEVNKDSVVLDNCAGTGGFLVSAMKRMLEDAHGNISKEAHIKKCQLVGIEYDEEIYTLLISNMIVHRDGRTNIIHGDCFDMDAAKLRALLKKKLKEDIVPNVGLLNPPYKNKGKGTEELEFVLNNLSMLERGGRCVAIMPVSCVTDTTGKSRELKDRLLQEHTLEAVLSLPEELVANSKVNTVTCAVVITAGVPHPSNKKTWFGYCRNDGFVKKKNQGRVDANHTWDKIKERWVEAFINREVIPEFSVMQKVTASDEWCAEAYLQADYDRLTVDDFKQTVMRYNLFCMQSAQMEPVGDEEDAL